MTKSMAKRAKQETRKPGEQAVKKSYVAPRLVEYGNVAKLTSSNGTAIPFDTRTTRMTSLVCL